MAQSISPTDAHVDIAQIPWRMHHERVEMMGDQ
jgi:hypothetical protein